MRLNLAPLIRQFGATADSYAAAASSGGSAGTATLVSSSIPGLLVPASERGLLGPGPIAGGRVDYWWIDAGTATVRVGGALHVGTVTYMVQGTADWRMGRAVALSLPF